MTDRRSPAVAALLLLWAGAVLAAPVTYRLLPGSAQVQFRAYGMGVMPIDGGFDRFDGTLALEGAEGCTADLRAEAGSLRMPGRSMTEDALGSDGLDAARFPEFRLQGRCEGGKLVGTLALHGVTRPVSLVVERSGRQWEASGSIRRAEWGMDARPLTAGPTVRITLTVGLPQ